MSIFEKELVAMTVRAERAEAELGRLRAIESAAKSALVHARHIKTGTQSSWCNLCIAEDTARAPRSVEARPGDPTVRHVVAWMRATYPMNQHAVEWADEIDHVFLGAPRSGDAKTGWGTIELPYRPAEDIELTCLVCSDTPCAFEIRSKCGGATRFTGLCAACRSGFVLRELRSEAAKHTCTLCGELVAMVYGKTGDDQISLRCGDCVWTLYLGLRTAEAKPVDKNTAHKMLSAIADLIESWDNGEDGLHVLAQVDGLLRRERSHAREEGNHQNAETSGKASVRPEAGGSRQVVAGPSVVGSLQPEDGIGKSVVRHSESLALLARELVDALGFLPYATNSDPVVHATRSEDARELVERALFRNGRWEHRWLDRKDSGPRDVPARTADHATPADEAVKAGTTSDGERQSCGSSGVGSADTTTKTSSRGDHASAVPAEGEPKSETSCVAEADERLRKAKENCRTDRDKHSAVRFVRQAEEALAAALKDHTVRTFDPCDECGSRTESDGTQTHRPHCSKVRAVTPVCNCGTPPGADHGILCPAGRSDTPDEVSSSYRAAQRVLVVSTDEYESLDDAVREVGLDPERVAPTPCVSIEVGPPLKFDGHGNFDLEPEETPSSGEAKGAVVPEETIARVLDEARSEGRRETIEECAKVCVEEIEEWEGEDARAVASVCASRIRAMQKSQKGGGT